MGEKTKNQVVLLAGSGRSGTSWLLDLLTLDHEYRPIFEPLNWLQVPRAANLYNIYLRPEDEHEEMLKFMTDVFYRSAGEAWARWMHFGISKETPLPRKILQYGYNLPKYKFWARKRVIKEIKGNLMLSWLQKWFDVKIVYLMRNPCAVVASQRKFGWDSRLERFLQQPKLVEDYLRTRMDLIGTSKTASEKLAILWCVENTVPLNQMQRGTLNALLCFYEDIVSEPDNELHRILSYLELPEDKIARFIRLMMKKMPPTKSSLIKWRKSLENSEIDYILDAAARFDINYYGSK